MHLCKSIKLFSIIYNFLGKTIINGHRVIIRFLTGAWCLTCFVIVTAYSSVLVAFLTSPDLYKPMIESVNELPLKPEIKVTVNKGWLMDVISKVRFDSFFKIPLHDFKNIHNILFRTIILSASLNISGSNWNVIRINVVKQLNSALNKSAKVPVSIFL